MTGGGCCHLASKGNALPLGSTWHCCYRKCSYTLGSNLTVIICRCGAPPQNQDFRFRRVGNFSIYAVVTSGQDAGAHLVIFGAEGHEVAEDGSPDNFAAELAHMPLCMPNLCLKTEALQQLSCHTQACRY